MPSRSILSSCTLVTEPGHVQTLAAVAFRPAPRSNFGDPAEALLGIIRAMAFRQSVAPGGCLPILSTACRRVADLDRRQLPRHDPFQYHSAGPSNSAANHRRHSPPLSRGSSSGWPGVRKTCLISGVCLAPQANSEIVTVGSGRRAVAASQAKSVPPCRSVLGVWPRGGSITRLGCRSAQFGSGGEPGLPRPADTPDSIRRKVGSANAARNSSSHVGRGDETAPCPGSCVLAMSLVEISTYTPRPETTGHVA